MRGSRHNFKQALCPSLVNGGALAPQTEPVEIPGPKVPSKVHSKTQRGINVQQPALVRTGPPSSLKEISKGPPRASTIDLPGRHTNPADEAPSAAAGANRNVETEKAALDSTNTRGELVKGPLSDLSASFNEEEVISGIVDWLIKQEPNSSSWDQLSSRAQSRMIRPRGDMFKAYPRPFQELTFERLVEECCPGKMWLSGVEKTDFLADWIVNTLTYVYWHPNQIRQVLRKATDLLLSYQLRNS